MLSVRVPDLWGCSKENNTITWSLELDGLARSEITIADFKMSLVSKGFAASATTSARPRRADEMQLLAKGKIWKDDDLLKNLLDVSAGSVSAPTVPCMLTMTRAFYARYRPEAEPKTLPADAPSPASAANVETDAQDEAPNSVKVATNLKSLPAILVPVQPNLTTFAQVKTVVAARLGYRADEFGLMVKGGKIASDTDAACTMPSQRLIQARLLLNERGRSRERFKERYAEMMNVLTRAEAELERLLREERARLADASEVLLRKARVKEDVEALKAWTEEPEMMVEATVKSRVLELSRRVEA